MIRRRAGAGSKDTGELFSLLEGDTMMTEEAVPSDERSDGGGEVEIPAKNEEEEITTQDVSADVADFPEDAGATGDDDDDSSQSTAPPDDSPDLTEDLYGDDVADMTYGRRLARYLSKYQWYYPLKKHEEAYREAAVKDRDFAAIDADDKPASTEHISFRDGDEKPPSLDAAWAYFEHVVLPRHFVRPQDSARASSSSSWGGTDEEGIAAVGGGTAMRAMRGSITNATSAATGAVRQSLTKTASVFTLSLANSDDKYQRAEPGEHERPTALYPIWDTPEEQLADFGIGVGLYFNSLKVLSIILAIAGLICIPAMKFYSGAEYSANRQAGLYEGGLSGSAVCTDHRWVACPDCTPQQWDSSFPGVQDRYAYIDGGDGETLSFILKNFCEVDFKPGLFLFIALLFVTVSIYAYGHASSIKEIQFDEAQQTTTDYSIEVIHPPKDAKDPEEWRQFFSEASGGHVTVCTIALDNEELVRALLTRRMKYMHLQMMMPGATRLRRSDLKEQVANMPKLSWWKWLYMAVMHMAFSPKLVFNTVQMLERRIEELSKKEYDVSHVFVTFETEAAQRQALAALDTPYRNVKTNNINALPENLRFRGKHVLYVQEPPEPDAVRWQDLDETFMQRVRQQTISMIITLICVVGGGVLIALARRRSAAASAIVIIILNSLTPIVVKQIVNMCESHPSEGSKQSSLYIKMTILRWVNTAIITTVISPFTDTVTNGPDHLLQSIYAIFFAELVKTPILQMSDYMSQLKRHFFGPRISDRRFRQEQFAGGYYTLAERLTDMTKVIFLTFYYCTIFPASFFFAAGTLVIHYWTDKFCILRTWQRAPLIGPELSKFSRYYIYPLTILTFAITLAYNYGSFPFDNACEMASSVVTGSYVMSNATATRLDGKPVSVTIEEGDPSYQYCFQNLIRIKPPSFPPLPSDQRNDASWMTDGQEKMLIILGWTFIAILIWVCFIYFTRIVLAYFRDLFLKTYKPSGEAKDIKFSKLPEKFGYVPQCKLPGSNYPALICDISTIDDGLVGWGDPNHSYDRHNMIFDVPGFKERILKRRRSLARGENTDDEKGRQADIFSIVCDWAPTEVDTTEEATKEDDVAEDGNI